MKSPVLTALLIPLGALAIAAPLFALTIRPDANPASSSGGTSTTAASGRGASGAITTASQNGQATAATPATTVAQYVDQRRGVIDQVARTPYTADASYAIGTIPQDTPPLVPGQDVELVQEAEDGQVDGNESWAIAGASRFQHSGCCERYSVKASLHKMECEYDVVNN